MQYKFGYLHKDLATVRIHDSNKSADSLTKNRIELQTMQLVTNLYCSPAMRRTAKKFITSKYFYSGLSQVRAGNYKQGFSWLFMAFTDYNFYYSKLKKIFK